MNRITSILPQPGRRVRAQDFHARVPFHHEGFPAVLLWSEKSACTVAAKWFFYHVGLLDDALAASRWVHHYEHEVFKADPAYGKSCAQAIRNGKPVLKFVRNPYLRAFSGFLETCNRRTLKAEDHWSTRTRRAILMDLMGTDTEIEYAYSFHQFVSWMGRQPKNRLDPHLAPQYQSFESRIEVKSVKLEDHPNAFLHVEKELGLRSTARAARVHSSGHHHDTTPTGAAVAKSLLSVGLPVQRRSDFALFQPTAATIAASPSGKIIRRVFADDFTAYGYGAEGAPTE